MKIIAWNCNMKFRGKINRILKFNPDIMVISECEEFSKFNDELLKDYPYKK